MKKVPLLLLLALIMWSVCTDAQVFTPIDVNTGAGGSNPRWFTEYNGKTYFFATGDAATGSELWVTDGTQAGTSLIKDIAVGPANAGGYSLKVSAGKLFFTAEDSVHGNELWMSDGTAAGTTLVKDIFAGSGSAYPINLTDYNNKLYFTAKSNISGSELWVTDGTTAGTVLIKDIRPGISGSDIQGYRNRNGLLNSELNVLNGKLYFRANDGVHGIELWVSDGTSAGTNMLADIWQGPGDGIPFLMTLLNGRMIFSGQDSLHGLELWTSDGTSAGTALLKDINPGDYSASVASVSGYVELNGKLYFSAMQETTGYELWSTDGTSAGTKMVKDIWAGPGDSRAGDIYTLVNYNNKLYFSAQDSLNGEQLWTSDGTDSGTALVKVISAVTPYAAQPRGLIVYGGQLIFTVESDVLNGRQLYTSDGTAAGTHVISPPIAPNIDPLVLNINGIPLAIANGDLYMNANFNSIGDEVWRYSLPNTAITETTEDSRISAYPNPFSTSLSLSGLQINESYTVDVTDMTGRVCYTTEIKNASAASSIAMPELTTGIYLMHVSGVSGGRTFRMVRQ